MRYKARIKKYAVDPRLLIGGVLLIFTVLMIFMGMRALFGKSEPKTEEMKAPETTVLNDADMQLVERLQANEYVRGATIYGVSGHNVDGAAQMRITFSEYEMTMAASLPALDPSMERYEAWMLQPGVADYFSVGTFFPRADGWYGLTFKDSLVRVPREPQTFTRVLITRETLKDDAAPSNIRIAEGFFNL